MNPRRAPEAPAPMATKKRARRASSPKADHAPPGQRTAPDALKAHVQALEHRIAELECMMDRARGVVRTAVEGAYALVLEIEDRIEEPRLRAVVLEAIRDPNATREQIAAALRQSGWNVSVVSASDYLKQSFKLLRFKAYSGREAAFHRENDLVAILLHDAQHPAIRILQYLATAVGIEMSFIAMPIPMTGERRKAHGRTEACNSSPR